MDAKKGDMKLMAIQGDFEGIETRFGEKYRSKCWKWLRQKAAALEKARGKDGQLPHETSPFLAFFVNVVGAKEPELAVLLERWSRDQDASTALCTSASESAVEGTGEYVGEEFSAEVLMRDEYLRGVVNNVDVSPCEDTLSIGPKDMVATMRKEHKRDEEQTQVLKQEHQYQQNHHHHHQQQQQQQQQQQRAKGEDGDDRSGGSRAPPSSPDPDFSREGSPPPPRDMSPPIVEDASVMDTPGTPLEQSEQEPSVVNASTVSTPIGRGFVAPHSTAVGTVTATKKTKAKAKVTTGSRSVSNDNTTYKPTSFMVFCDEARSMLPPMSVPDSGRELGRLWKALSDEERLEYKSRAAAMKVVAKKSNGKRGSAGVESTSSPSASAADSRGERSSRRKTKSVNYREKPRDRDSDERRRKLARSGEKEYDMYTYPMDLPLPERLHAAVPLDGVVAGIKQTDLTADEDLLGTDFLPPAAGSPTGDAAVLVAGAEVALVTRPYLDFIMTLPEDVNPSQSQGVHDDQLNSIFATCDEVLRGTVHLVGEVFSDACRTLKVNFSSSARSTEIVYQEVAHSSSETFLLPADDFDASLKRSWLVVNAPVRKLFRLTDGTFEWSEGIVYHIAPDMESNPFESVRVAWVDQEKDTCYWHYSFNQFGNICSPWDLELSAYVLPSRVSSIQAPELPLVLKTLPVFATDIVDYIKRFDFVWPFMLDLGRIEEFTSTFPNPDDQLDLLKLAKRAEDGYYDHSRGGPDVTPDNGTSLKVLFADLKTMCAHGKQFNQGNESFQTWRCIDMVEMCIYDLQLLLLAAHPGDDGRGGMEALRPTVEGWIRDTIASRKSLDEAL